MEMNNALRAQVLIHALPFIQKYTDKIVVVKYGGNAMINEDLKQAVMNDVVLLSLVGIKVVLVHGGGPEISDTLKQMDIPSKFVDGLRVTDADTMNVVQMVLAGKVNKDLVNILQCSGGKAMGLSGIDGHMIQAVKLDDVHGFVGEITNINTDVILDVLDKGYIPVISTVACDAEGNVYNINADTAAAQLAVALNAEKLILLTDIRGLLRDPKDEETLINVVHTYDVPKLIEEGVISGGMIPKMECCVDAIHGGVDRVHILDGRIPHSILIELLSDKGIGTMMIHEEGD